ncbi:MAG TPA: hypothetical protein GXX59_11170 [Syntrophomonadaceae bacterium]|nr:hypothetical protein [Syntrophomonadaceae bacterium]
MTTMIEEKTSEIFDFIKSKSSGVTRNELVEYLNSNSGFFFSSFISLNDLLRIHILLGRLHDDGHRLMLTEEGINYLK